MLEFVIVQQLLPTGSVIFIKTLTDNQVRQYRSEQKTNITMTTKSGSDPQSRTK